MDDRDKRPQVVAGIMIGGKGSPEASRVGLVSGAMIFLIGVAFLLDHLGLIHIGSIFSFWPMILVCFGIGHLFTRSTRAWGLILLAIGAVFQLNNLGIMHMGIADLWPLAIIIAGLFLMWTALKPPVIAKGTGDASDTLDAVAVFGGTERRISSQTFRGGRATSVFGGVELDFRDANIDGDEATVEIQCIFGGVEIRVPETWNVHSKSIPVLGGYADKTRGSATPQDGSAAKRKTLIITGSIVFGGVEIGN
jgi:predicted membrane protein